MTAEIIFTWRATDLQHPSTSPMLSDSVSNLQWLNKRSLLV